MNLSELSEILDTEVLICGERLAYLDVIAIAAADMMSEVLAYSHGHSVLLTGLTTPQVVRTAQIMDLTAIVFVRGKVPPRETIKLAADLGIPLLVTKDLLYTACGKLYAKGIPSC
ncbi:MAG: hypothetical protein U1C55_08405 [Smithellaceae bacterium]|nr:hypothetical protein [Smithellaceae bacterium]